MAAEKKVHLLYVCILDSRTIEWQDRRRMFLIFPILSFLSQNWSTIQKYKDVTPPPQERIPMLISLRLKNEVSNKIPWKNLLPND